MMRVEPFHEDVNADTHFLSELKEISDARPHLGRHLAAAAGARGSAITEFMRQKRLTPLNERRDFYFSARIREQMEWYANKAKTNATTGARWFWAIAFLQLVLVIFAVAQTAADGLRINLVPTVTTCAATMAAWSLMKRHDELAQSYALAAQELEQIEAIASSQTTEGSFSELVEQAENSISREHTMWCARRDVRL